MAENDDSERYLPELSHLTKLMPAGVSSLRATEAGLEPRRPAWQRVSHLRDEYALGPTAWTRLGRVYRAEVAEPPRIVERDWLAEVSPQVPGLAVSMRYERSDVHEVYSRLRALDLAHRRAATVLMVASGGTQTGGQPLRPERGGLWLVRSDVGSFDGLMTLYGELATIAASTPVSLASLASLSLHATSTVKRAGRWFVRLLTGPPQQDPQAQGSDDGEEEPWGPDITKTMEAVMHHAVDQGAGMELVHESEHGTLRLTVFPRE